VSGRAEHITLGWWLLERKVAYYMPEAVHTSWGDRFVTPDDLYDQQEKRYLELCREHGKENTIVHKGYPGFEDVPGSGMMEVDVTRPSVQLVLKKLGSPRESRRGVGATARS
jgi:hypothetical protein